MEIEVGDCVSHFLGIFCDDRKVPLFVLDELMGLSANIILSH